MSISLSIGLVIWGLGSLFFSYQSGKHYRPGDSEWVPFILTAFWPIVLAFCFLEDTFSEFKRRRNADTTKK